MVVSGDTCRASLPGSMGVFAEELRRLGGKKRGSLPMLPEASHHARSYARTVVKMES